MWLPGNGWSLPCNSHLAWCMYVVLSFTLCAYSMCPICTRSWVTGQHGMRDTKGPGCGMFRRKAPSSPASYSTQGPTRCSRETPCFSGFTRKHLIDHCVIQATGLAGPSLSNLARKLKCFHFNYGQILPLYPQSIAYLVWPRQSFWGWKLLENSPFAPKVCLW